MPTTTTCNIAPCEGKRFSTLRGYAQHCGVAHKDVGVERLATADSITKLSKCQDCKRCFLCHPVPRRHDCKSEDVIQKERAVQVAASKKQTLDNKTSEELDRIAKQDAERMQQQRDNRTIEERKRISAQQAHAEQQRRDNRTDEQRKRISAQQAHAEQQRRDNRTDEEQERVARQDAERQQQQRDNRTAEERRRVLEQQRVRRQAAIAAERETPQWKNEQTRRGTIYSDIDAHLNYCTSTSEVPTPPEETKEEKRRRSIRETYKAAKEIEHALRSEMFNTVVCACCGWRLPEGEMVQQPQEPGSQILEQLTSRQSEWMPRPTRIKLVRHASSSTQAGSQDYSIHHSYEGKDSVRICNVCYKALAKNELPELCIKTVDVGEPPKGKLKPGDSATQVLPPLKFAERLLVSPVKHNYFLTTIYDKKTKKVRHDGLKGHVTSFMTAPPEDVASALTEHYPASIAELGNIIKVVLITGGTKEEAIERAKKSMVGMEVDPRKVLLWCEHIVEQYGRRNWHYLQVTFPILLCDRNDFMLSRLYMHVAKVIRYGTPLTYILIGWFLLQESLRVSRESRDKLNTITTVGVPQSIIDNMTVISDEDGAAALRVTEKFTRRAYMPRSGQQQEDDEEEDEVEADEDEEDILRADANDDQEHVDPLEYSLCHEEPNVSQADRLQYAAMKQLETIARKEQDPEDMGIVERNDLAYQRGEGGNMDDEDEENLERGRKLVLTFDGNHPVRSFDPEWFMLTSRITSQTVRGVRLKGFPRRGGSDI